MHFVLMILIFAKFFSIRCDDDNDCSEAHPEGCSIDGDLIDPTLDLDRDTDSVTLMDIYYDLTKLTIPKNFDARTKWPQCAKTISRIKNQGKCNNCWSFSSTMAFADRVCIASNGTDHVDFSIVDLVNCCANCLSAPKDPPCKHGGFVNKAWDYAIKEGMVFEECKPWDPDKLNKTVASCDKQCVNKTLNIENRRHKGITVIYGTEFPDLDQIRAEIMKHGPLCGRMENITHEFSSYWGKKGNYVDCWRDQITFSDPLELFVPVRPIPIPAGRSGHSVRIIGWGAEKDANGVDTDYWLIANSWGTKWADQGVVKLPVAFNDFNINERFWGVVTGPLTKAERGGAPAANLTSKFLVFTTMIFFFGRQFLL